jgi:hypothetical protein
MTEEIQIPVRVGNRQSTIAAELRRLAERDAAIQNISRELRLNEEARAKLLAADEKLLETLAIHRRERDAILSAIYERLKFPIVRAGT